MKQKDQILQYMREHGSITPVIADKYCGCLRLAARIFELRGLHCINKVMVRRRGKRYAAYSLVEGKRSKVA
jgi:hypothetical protein